MSDPYEGQLQDRSPQVGDGDGDGDGDCTQVTRTIVTGVQEDSGAFCEVTGGLPLVIPSASPLVLPLGLVAAGGGAQLLPNNAIEFAANALHKAACNLGIVKLGGGANVCRLVCESQYGSPFGPWSAVPGGTFEVSLGGAASDELPPISFEAPLFSPSFASQPSPVRFRWTVQEIGGGGGPLALYRGFVYGFQIQPVVTTETIENCEAGAPPGSCPSVTEVRIYDNTDPQNRVLLATKPPGVGPFNLGPSTFPIYAEIDVDQAIVPAEWSADFSQGDQPDPPISVTYASQTWSVSYTQPAPTRSQSVVVASLSQLPDAGTCEITEALTRTFVA